MEEKFHWPAVAEDAAPYQNLTVEPKELNNTKTYFPLNNTHTTVDMASNQKLANSVIIKGALCSFGEDILNRREWSSLT